MLPDLYYGIAAYNERDNILNCLESLASQDLDAKVETLICINGCTDGTEEKVIEGIQRYPKLNTKLLHSKKSKTFAQRKIAQSIQNRDVPLVFVDADVILDSKCIDILYSDICDLDDLIVVGTWPIPYKPDNLSPWEKFLYRILHVRAFHPESEISVNDVSAYKSFVAEKSQPNIAEEFELKSKIYFHGRTFMLRNADYSYLPEDPNIADDTYLPNYIHTTHGPGTIRTRFDAQVFYKPYLSLKDHYRSYRKVFWDLNNIDKKEEFKESRRMEETKLDWNYITSKGPLVTSEFLLYAALAFCEEKIIYKIFPKKSLSEVWTYEEK